MSITSAADGWTMMRENADQIIERWSTAAGQSLGGRITQAELRRDVREMFEALIEVSDVDHHDLTAAAFSDLRSLLADVARTRELYTLGAAVLDLYASQGLDPEGKEPVP